MAQFLSLLISIFFSLVGSYLNIPFAPMQYKQCQCNGIWIGFLQSFRSFVALCCAVITGHLSDKYGRKTMLLIGITCSILSSIIGLYETTFYQLILMILISSWNQNTAICKALSIDQIKKEKLSDSFRSTQLGNIGIAAGMAFIVGPLIAPYLASNSQEVALYSILMYSIALLIYLGIPSSNNIPHPPFSSSRSPPSSKASLYSSLSSIFHSNKPQLPVLLLSIRFLMGVAYSIFNTSFTLHLQDKHSFKSLDHGRYMSWIGCTYVVSQYFGPPILTRLKSLRPNSSPMILFICSVIISIGRLIAVSTSRVDVIYFMTFAVGMSVGVMNIILAEAVSVATIQQTGTLYGAMEAMEKAAVMIGPSVGGWLYTLNVGYPAFAVAGIYLSIGTFSLEYRKYLTPPITPMPTMSVTRKMKKKRLMNKKKN